MSWELFIINVAYGMDTETFHSMVFIKHNVQRHNTVSYKLNKMQK
jgi:hypothetical protein